MFLMPNTYPKNLLIQLSALCNAALNMVLAIAYLLESVQASSVGETLWLHSLPP